MKAHGNGHHNDELLVQRILDGDESAAQELFDRHLARLRRRVRERLPHGLRRKVAESDVIQEAYLVAFRRLADFEDRGEGSFGHWLAQILNHKIQDEVRRYLGTRKRGEVREVTRADRRETREFLGGGASPSSHAIETEQKERMVDALGELPAHYREVLRLVHEECLTLAEAGARLDKSSEAVRKLYGRAVSRLTELTEDRDEPQG